MNRFFTEKKAQTKQEESLNVKANKTLLSIPLPLWINRWAYPLFILSVVIPVALLYFIKQPVFEQYPFFITQERGKLLLVSEIRKDMTQINLIGQEVMLRSSFNGDDNHSAYGVVTFTRPVQHRQSLEVYIHSRQMIDLLSRSPTLEKQPAGYAWFKKRQVRIIEKIFDL